ncbi:MAG: sigma-70 family RNA polymerase sigma factor [Thermoanaerobaculia bacterium]|nr:sigma-70 family RNA polymerase sigma factor [Thermoanaerobaculia bacterium]
MTGSSSVDTAIDPIVDATEDPAGPNWDHLTRLVESARGGDREAFGQIVELTWPRLVRLASVVLAGRTAEAEDVVQDSLVVAWSKLRSLRSPEALHSWLRRIVVRRCYRVARSVASVPLFEQSCPPHGDLQIDMPVLLARLSPRQRAVVYLDIEYGLSDAEIGAQLGMLPPTVRVHRMRARRKLKHLLGGDS